MSESELPKYCDINRADNMPAKFVFRHPDGSENYICEIHVNAYAKSNPSAVKTEITA